MKKLLTLAAATLLSACQSTHPPARPASTVKFYLQRIALPPSAT
jgi:putative lipoprotein